MTTNKQYPTTRHWVQLKELGYIGATMAQINAIEHRAHKFAERLCNENVSEAEQVKTEKKIMEQVTNVFGGTMPAGFHLNLDPRGYALKLDLDDAARGQCPVKYTDWGGYIILAPDFKG